MKKQAKLWLSLSIGIILILAIISMIFFLGSIRQETIQSSTADMSILSISKTTINGKEGFRILASASKGAEQLSINWNPSTIQSMLSKAGINDYSATKAVTGSFKYDKQSLFFPYQPSAGSNKIYKQIRWVNKGVLASLSCNADKCTSDVKTGEELIWVGVPSVSCVCMIASEVAEYGQFAGATIGDYQVTFAIDGLGSTKSTRDTRSANLGTKASLRWEGNLDSLDSLSAPDYDLALFNSQIFMLDKGTYNKAYTDYTRDCAPLNILHNFASCTESLGWSASTTLTNSVNEYNSKLNSYWIDRFNYYKTTGVDSSFIDVAILNNSGLKVYTKQPTSYPVFTIDLDAQAVGIIKLSGKPSIVNTNDCEFDSNNIGQTQITVKNTGEQGCFNIGFENCNLISGYTAGSNSLGCFGAGENKDIDLNVAGSTTSTTGETGSCLITVYDVNTPSNKDTYDLSCKVNYNPGSLCSFGKTICDSGYKNVLKCQGDPRAYVLLEKCSSDNKCMYDTNGNAICKVPATGGQSQNGGSSCSTFDLLCKINEYFMKLRIALSILIGLIGGALAGWLSLSFTDKLTTKQRTGIYLIAMAILGIGLGFIFFAYFWFALIVLFILFLVKMFLPDKKIA